jgi:hypothetical protein
MAVTIRVRGYLATVNAPRPSTARERRAREGRFGEPTEQEYLEAALAVSEGTVNRASHRPAEPLALADSATAPAADLRRVANTEADKSVADEQRAMIERIIEILHKEVGAANWLPRDLYSAARTAYEEYLERVEAERVREHNAYVQKQINKGRRRERVSVGGSSAWTSACGRRAPPRPGSRPTRRFSRRSSAR